ncbi:hypothetical protein [Pseudidiomarina terrestris]|uniref:Uncharacterized protein n=1 Tax=Pseudidiomarina terrestris TaxID=2820060 RepID=A0AAW7R0B7_9GAMM|nr:MULTISPECIES: hypothetical protein [unclassified Pseudidiomarina]MDN7124412.1 hypothetical protein [Pseudidiomarina sp. 1APP75-32.1]MDN7129297.1 hypothetical protein [Pseudidiomarina sp. 1APR75-15]MDN7134437.1 hypothetical protein [Pseudidiomarina sp. 1ASP75-5]MEA3587768.1 hypothetical protein [Pseudidiomarina sp. 1APP75-27a]
MKIIKILIAAALLALSFGVQAQDRQTVVIEGAEVLDSEVFFYFPGATTYKLYIEFDTTLTPTFTSPTEKQYDNAVTGFNIEFFDASGVLIPGPSVEYDADDTSLSPNMSPRVWFYSGSSDVLSFEINTLEREIGHWIDISGPAGSLYSDIASGFPQFAVGATDARVSYIHMAVGPEWNPHFDVYGAISQISYLELDADGDGFADSADSCPASLMDETVMFDGWLDSGVTNYVDASGCAIMDHYAACAVAEAEEPTSPWGWFQPVYSGPTYCEKQVVYQLQDEGVIDYTEGRMLRNALSLSYSSEGPRR